MAAAGFRIRRIKTESSIGDRLKRARIRQKITVSQVEEATKIRAKFILALESDSWEQIPSEVYGRGYLERYVQYLHLPDESIMKQFDRERTMYARHCQDAQVELAPRPRLKFPRFLLTPRFFVLSLAFIVLLACGGVVTYQIHKFTAVPYLHLTTPAEAKVSSGQGPVINTSSMVVEGETSVGATVQVNGVQADISPSGHFRATVSLPGKGSHQIIILATNAKGTTSESFLVTN